MIDSAETEPGCRSAASPASSPATSIAPPPQSISAEAAFTGSAGIGMRAETNEPAAQQNAAASATSSPATGTPGGRPGSSSTATPKKPSATDPAVTAPISSPAARRNTTTHSGTDAMTSAAMPDASP